MSGSRPERPGGFPVFERTEAAMVSTAMMMQSAMRAYRRWGTAMSAAMLRALGVGLPRRAAPPVEDPEEDAEMRWCRANFGSPMDGRR